MRGIKLIAVCCGECGVEFGDSVSVECIKCIQDCKEHSSSLNRNPSGYPWAWTAFSLPTQTAEALGGRMTDWKLLVWIGFSVGCVGPRVGCCVGCWVGC